MIGPTEDRSGVQTHTQSSKLFGGEGMKNKILLVLVTLLLMTTTLFGMGSNENLSSLNKPISVVDSRGVEIQLEAYPTKIVSLSPNITETLFALGLADKVVGRTDYCDWPLEALEIESMGDLFSPSIEKIVASGADLVISGNFGQALILEAVEQGGVNIALFDEDQSMEGTYTLIEKVGQITGSSEKATSLLNEMKQTVDKVVASIDEKNRPTVYYVAGFGEWGDFSATGDTYINDILNIAGGINIAADARNWTFQQELLIQSDPDIIILPPNVGATFEQTKNEFTSHPVYSNLSAVKNNKVVSIEENILERQGPRSAKAVEQLASLFKSLM